MKKSLTVREAGRLGGKKAAETRTKEEYSKMAKARWDKQKIAEAQ